MDPNEVPDSEGEGEHILISHPEQPQQVSEISQFPATTNDPLSSIQPIDAFNSDRPQPRPKPYKSRPTEATSSEAIEPATSSSAQAEKLPRKSSGPSYIEISDSDDELRLRPVQRTSSVAGLNVKHRTKDPLATASSMDADDGYNPSADQNPKPQSTKKKPKKKRKKDETEKSKPREPKPKKKAAKPEMVFKSAEFVFDSDDEGSTFPTAGPSSHPFFTEETSSPVHGTTPKKKSKNFQTIDREQATFSHIQQPSFHLPRDREPSPSVRRYANAKSKLKKRALVSDDDEISEPPVTKKLRLEPDSANVDHPVQDRSNEPDDMEDAHRASSPSPSRNPSLNSGEAGEPSGSQPNSPVKENEPPTPSFDQTPVKQKYPSISAKYTVNKNKEKIPMSELIRRASSHPNSPFPSAPPSGRKGSSGSPASFASSPFYLKNSKRFVSKIAPLHPNRRTPPPPPPPPPPRKKTKKELDLEEKWEEELVDEVGIDSWASMTSEERTSLRTAKFKQMRGEIEDW